MSPVRFLAPGPVVVFKGHSLLLDDALTVLKPGLHG
jgi:hypothetical protein